ncbi:periplasmic component [Paenibacillus popilliae ATCC 14706]|uniref:Periplasmic component n=2 Tax=Paenibacillus popilliae TaxID=78057 RepID=M9LH96_PAEPP|nr:periplasmic component [Paenibacillus popilliae ATCC 14706]
MCDNEASFYSQYGDIFTIKYPNIDLEVMSTAEVERQGEDDEEMKKWIEKHKPDVLLLDAPLFASYAQEGKLYNLEEVIAEEKFDVAGYMPGVIDNLRAKGNGTLYGLAPSFTVPVLYYNRDIFEENHIELPRNKMTWQEVFDLSKRFEGIGSGENRVFGLFLDYRDTIEVLKYIAATFSLQMFDSKAEKFLIHSDHWKRAVKLATDAVRSKTVSFDNSNSNHPDAFMEEKAAMTIDWPLRTQMFQDPGFIGGKKINWGMVTIPVDPKNPDESLHVELPSITAIAADSPNKPAAWAFVKFVNEPEMAKASSRAVGGPLPTRGQFLKEMDGINTESFYMLKPTAQTSYFWYHKDVPEEFYDLCRPLLADALKAIVDNKKTVDEALAELEVQGQDALVKAREAKLGV